MKEYKYKINGMNYTVAVGDVNGDKVNVEVNGTAYTVEMDKAAAPKVAKVVAEQAKRPATAPRTESGEKVIAKPVVAAGSASAVKSPLPGTIMSFRVNVGDTVNAGDTVCVLEAMKMENDICAPEDGTVASVNVQKGASVNTDDVLVTLK
jgi:biotin carboxyl carrier protein